jgi:hypothetical protein
MINKYYLPFGKLEFDFLHITFCIQLQRSGIFIEVSLSDIFRGVQIYLTEAASILIAAIRKLPKRR